MENEVNSDVVKPNIFGRMVSYSVSGLLAILLVCLTIWVVLKLSPLMGGIVVLVLVVGAYAGLTQLLGDFVLDIGGLLGGYLFVSWIALKLTPDQVDSSRFLKFFFYVDRSRPLTGREGETV